MSDESRIELESRQLARLIEAKDKAEAAYHDLETLTDGQIDTLAERLHMWNNALISVRDEYRDYKVKVHAWVAQNELQWKLAEEDLDNYMKYVCQRIEGQRPEFPVLHSLTHEAFTKPLPEL